MKDDVPDDLPLRDFAPRSQLVADRHVPDRARFAAVDAHTHLGRWLTGWVGRPGTWMVDDVAGWLERMAERNVHAFVNLDGRFGDELRDNIERFDQAHPGRFATFAHPDWRLMAEGRADRLGADIAASAAAGARGVKVWKDLGLAVRDEHDALVLPDDGRLTPLWDAIEEADLPVWWHVADPVAFFDPVDEHNENYELLRRRPEWSYHRPGLPSFLRLVDALESVVASRPGIRFVAVHAGCYAENLGRVGRMLDAYPNLHIDIAARLAQLGRQPRAFRALIERHPDRVLFGTDEIPHTGASCPTHFRFLETLDESFPHSDDEPPTLGRWTISGMGLPDELLHAVYAGNALRLLPSLEVSTG